MKIEPPSEDHQLFFPVSPFWSAPATGPLWQRWQREDGKEKGVTGRKIATLPSDV
jgi:hypothetical protein